MCAAATLSKVGDGGVGMVKWFYIAVGRPDVGCIWDRVGDLREGWQIVGKLWVFKGKSDL